MPEAYESPHVDVLLDINKRLAQINDIAKSTGQPAFGHGWDDMTNDIPPQGVYRQAMGMISRHPDVWYNVAGSTLMLAAASEDERELENRLIQTAAIITAWVADIRSRSRTTDRD